MRNNTERRHVGVLQSTSVVVAVALVAGACAGNSLPSGDSVPGSPDSALSESAASGIDADEATPPTLERGLPTDVSLSALSDQILVDLDTSIAFDRRLLGTNVPAWLGPERLGDPDFQSEAIASGATVFRMPGGSWSNSYDWLGCELADDSRCFWTWAARPTDFVDFLQATDIDGMWTVSINETAQAAAAAVSFFNGNVDDNLSLIHI